MELNSNAVQELRKDFPILEKNKGMIYLDSAATSLKPTRVLDLTREFYDTSNANIHRGAYEMSQRATEKYEEARKAVANFLNSSPEEIIFTGGATESLNFLAYTIDSIIPKEKDEIVLTEMEHHSNFVPWQQLAKRKNMKLKFIRMKEDLTLDMEDAKEKITDKTAILSFVHVSNSLGVLNPAEELVKIAKEKNAITVIDAAQSAGHIKIDVQKLGCDFLAFSGHKMLAPFGIGVLYGKSEILQKLPPFQFGGGMIKSVSLENSEWNKIPERFEAGTPNIEGAIGLGEAVRYLEEIGIENIKKYEEDLLKYLLGKLRGIKGIKIYNPNSESSGIISFNLENLHPHDVGSLLDDYGICVRTGHHCTMPLMKKLGVPGTVRVSFYFYNTFEEIDNLVGALNKILGRFGR